MKRTTISITVLALLNGARCMPAQDKDIRALAGTFADALVKSSKKTAAVVDFTDLNGCVTELGRYLAEQLSVSLAASERGIEVVDRNHLKVLLQEHKLSSSGIIDSATAQKLGQIAGVQVLVAGTLTPFGDSVQVTVKALDAATARIITASSADVAKTRAIDELLSRGVTGGCPVDSPLPGAGASGASGSGPVTSSIGRVQKQIVKGLELELTACQHRGDKLICEFRARSPLEDHEWMLLAQAYETVSRAVDDTGNMYPASQVQLGDQSNSQFAKTILPSGVFVIGRVIFAGVPGDVVKLSLLEIRFTDDWNNRAGGPKFQLRAVPVK